MENPAPLVQPITPPPVQPPANHAKIAFLILIIIILTVTLTTAFFLKIYSSTPIPSPTPTPLPTIEITPILSPSNTPIPTTTITPTAIPTPIPSPIISTSPNCDVPDNSLCRVISDLKTALEKADYSGFLAYQNIQSVTCDPDGMFVTICEGEAKGVE